jgi:hypothetical protein
MQYFETSDFYLACFLRTCGYKLIGMERQRGRSAFIFADQATRKETVLQFYTNEGLVPPLSFVDSIKNMKAMLHNA